MKISSVVVLQYNDDFSEATRVVDVCYEHSGYVMDCKKGREANQQNTAFQQQQAQNYANNANTGFNGANNFYQSELNLNPGGMSAPAAAMYSSDLNNINNTYNGLRQNAFATMGQRGFGNAPSGFAQSTQNALNLGQGNAQQNAYNKGIENTQQQRQNAASGEAGLYGQSTAGEAANTNAANTSAFNQSRMGSTLGDIAQGVGDAVGIAGSVAGMIPGGGGLGNFFSGAGASPSSPSSSMASLAGMGSGIGTQIPGLDTFGDPNAPSAAVKGSNKTFASGLGKY